MQITHIILIFAQERWRNRYTAVESRDAQGTPQSKQLVAGSSPAFSSFKQQKPKKMINKELRSKSFSSVVFSI